MSQNCPHCGEELGRMVDAFCGSCRGEIEPMAALLFEVKKTASLIDCCPFTVEVTSVATEIRPSRSTFQSEMLKMAVILVFSTGSLVWFYLADSRLFAWMLVLVAPILLLVFLKAVRSVSIRNHPLVVDAKGRLFYRDAELTRPNSTCQLQLEERGSSDSSPTYFLRLIHEDGSSTSLPNPYFTEIDDAADAVWLAKKLETLLGVKLEVVQ